MDFLRSIVRSEDIPDGAPVGGKARALAQLSAAGFAVPACLVVLPDVLALADVEGPMPTALAEALLEKVRGCFGAGERLAVRSSASDEDGQQNSFAGQLDSFLNVPPAEVPARVADVWRSGAGERVLAYRREHHLPAAATLPAVIVQRMVDAVAAGVAFGVDPVTGRRGVAVVSAVSGLGDRLVGGEVDADTWEIDRDGGIGSRRLAGGDKPVLTDEQVGAVAVLARRCGQHFHCPQDIEWAVDRAGKLWLLQSRPVTGLDKLPEADGAFAIWDNSNIAESYGGVTTPLTFSFARRVYESVYRQFCRMMGVPAARIAANEDTFRRMLGLIRGRVYYNLLNWYRVLALLPGYRTNRRFMEGMMGVKEPLPPEAVAELADGREPNTTPTFVERLRGLFALAGTFTGLFWNHWRLPRQKAAFQARLDDALRPPSPPLEAQRADELAAYYHHLESRLITRWDAPLVNDFFAMIYFGVLRKLAERWCGDLDGTLPNELLAGTGGIVSAEPARRVRELARLAALAPELTAVLRDGSVAAIERTIAGHAEFAAARRAYLDRFGDRCLEELKLETPTLDDEPLMLYRAIGRLAAVPLAATPAPAAGEVSPVAAAEAQANDALHGRWARGWIFQRVLRLARDRVRDRENLRFERTRVFGRVRRIFVELGRRFQVGGQLADARDVFYLAVDEVLGFVDGTAVGADLRALVSARKAEFDAYHREPAPPDRFVTRGAVHLGNAFTAPPQPSAPTTSEDGADERHGLACCAGVVRGPARVVLDPRTAQILPGEILVASRTDPGWVLLFPAAAGLAVEHGSLLSHSAIVARELRLPAVVSVSGLTAWLRTGDLIELNGATGRIRRLSSVA